MVSGSGLLFPSCPFFLSSLGIQQMQPLVNQAIGDRANQAWRNFYLDDYHITSNRLCCVGVERAVTCFDCCLLPPLRAQSFAPKVHLSALTAPREPALTLSIS